MAVQTCHNCVYSFCDPEVWLRNSWMGEPLLAQCANHPWWPGRMREVPGVPCRNYRPKPVLPKGDAVRLIPLGDGFYAYVDAADYEWLSQWSWRMVSAGYAARRHKGKWVFMHRQIMEPPDDMLVDHIDGSKANNCRFNLRICTRLENQRNMRKHHGAKSRFKGIYYHKKWDKWCARCRVNGKYHYLGYYDEEVEAARAYDRGAVEWYGEFARLNFPEEWPPERRAQVHAEWQETVRKEGREPAIKGRGPRTPKGKQEAGGRKTEDRGRTGGKAKAKKGGRVPSRAAGHESRSTPPKRTKRKTQNARRKTKKAGGRRP